MRAVLVTMVAIFVGLGAQAAEPTEAQKKQIQRLAVQYHQQQYAAQIRKNREARERRLGEERNDHTCACGASCGCSKPAPSPAECVNAVCSKMASYNCDDQSEILRVVKACRGNYGGACIKAVCSHMASYNCDDIGELERVASACRGNYDGGCIDMVCSKMASYNCDDIGEIEPIAKECAGL